MSGIDRKSKYRFAVEIVWNREFHYVRVRECETL